MAGAPAIAAGSRAVAAGATGITYGTRNLYNDVKKMAEEQCGGDSFAPGTRVLLADGRTRPISSLKPGDKVLAGEAPELARTSPRP